jgi:hypothetical protein
VRVCRGEGGESKEFAKRGVGVFRDDVAFCPVFFQVFKLFSGPKSAFLALWVRNSNPRNREEGT